MPVVLEDLLGLDVLGIDHEATGVAVEAVDHVGRTLLARLLEIIVEHGLDVERRVACRHGEDAGILLDDDEPAVFIDNLDIAALERLLVAFGLAHGDLHAWL